MDTSLTPPATTVDAARPGFGVTVDVVLLTVRQGRLCVLLVERRGDPYRGAWALPGGFVEIGEDLEAAALRELAEETGLHPADQDRRGPQLASLAPGIHLEQLKTYGTPGRDPRGRTVSVCYLGMLPDMPLPVAGSDAAQARWWPIEDLAGAEAPRLAFDHAEILRDGVERARAKLEYTSVSLAFVQEPFTFGDLRRVYEAVWGVELDHSNFRKKVLDNDGFVVPLGREAPRLKGGPGGRPAELYRRGEAFWLERAIIRPRLAALAPQVTPGEGPR
ncbi:MAG TPA: NUDIX domain-containing protein [Candidatus Dormibacteraeota bacterium]|nr:NUDIX domain-containing protein [Candidatus Dormibacteraeota bacterium]